MNIKVLFVANKRFTEQTSGQIRKIEINMKIKNKILRNYKQLSTVFRPPTHSRCNKKTLN